MSGESSQRSNQAMHPFRLYFPKSRREQLRRRPQKLSRKTRATAFPRLELLESRQLLTVTTFAQFQQVDVFAQNFVYTNNGTSASFQTITGGDPIRLSANPGLAPALQGPQRAHLFLNASTNVPAVLGTDNTLRELLPTPTNTLQIILDTPVGGHTNFLTVTFSDVLSGGVNSHSGNMFASDAATAVPVDVVSYSSDFIDFTNSIEHSFALSFTSINTATGRGLQQGPGGFYASFTASGTGTFDTNFPSSSISGLKFNDLNGNGVLVASGPGEAGVTLQLIHATAGAVLQSTVADSSGNFSFTGLAPGTYGVREGTSADTIQTTANPADSQATSGVNVSGENF